MLKVGNENQLSNLDRFFFLLELDIEHLSPYVCLQVKQTKQIGQAFIRRHYYYITMIMKGINCTSKFFLFMQYMMLHIHQFATGSCLNCPTDKPTNILAITRNKPK